MPRSLRGSGAGAGARGPAERGARPASVQMCSSWEPARGGAPGVWPRGGGRERALWGRHNALNTRLPPLCPAAPPACPAAPLYRAATSPSPRNARRPIGPGQPRRFKAARRVPTPAVRPRPRRPTRARPGPDPAGGSRGRGGRAPRSRGPRNLGLKGGRGAILHAAWRLRTPLPRQGPSILREGTGGRVSGEKTPQLQGAEGAPQAPAVSPPPHAESLQRPICVFLCRRAHLQNFCVPAASSPSRAAVGARIVRKPILQTLKLRPCEPSTGR